jgi:hypothetical protein
MKGFCTVLLAVSAFALSGCGFCKESTYYSPVPTGSPAEIIGGADGRIIEMDFEGFNLDVTLNNQIPFSRETSIYLVVPVFDDQDYKKAAFTPFTLHLWPKEGDTSIDPMATVLTVNGKEELHPSGYTKTAGITACPSMPNSLEDLSTAAGHLTIGEDSTFCLYFENEFDHKKWYEFSLEGLTHNETSFEIPGIKFRRKFKSFHCDSAP